MDTIFKQNITEMEEKIWFVCLDIEKFTYLKHFNRFSSWYFKSIWFLISIAPPPRDGMLNMRARPPPGDDFIDIFQKIKCAFNLLVSIDRNYNFILFLIHDSCDNTLI